MPRKIKRNLGERLSRLIRLWNSRLQIMRLRSWLRMCNKRISILKRYFKRKMICWNKSLVEQRIHWNLRRSPWRITKVQDSSWARWNLSITLANISRWFFNKTKPMQARLLNLKLGHHCWKKGWKKWVNKLKKSVSNSTITFSKCRRSTISKRKLMTKRLKKSKTQWKWKKRNA